MYPEKMVNLYRGDDVVNRIHNTVIRYDGTVYYASGSGGKLSLYKLPYDDSRGAPKPLIVDIDDEKIDISSIELGYVNNEINPKYLESQSTEKLRVFYAIRHPSKRGYRQGISDGNVSLEDLNGKLTGTTFSIHNFGIANMLHGIYPKFDEALLRLKTEGEVALSKEIALSLDRLGIMKVYYRGEAVGFIPPNDQKVYLRQTATAWIFRKKLSVLDFPFKLANQEI